MVDWPETLPTSMFAGLTDRREPTARRSSNDTGPANQRKRYTAAVRKISTPFSCNNTQRIIFDAFWDDDLEGGVLSFNWTDPVSNATVSFRFIATEPPEWRGEVGADANALDHDTVKRWSTSLMLEILP